MVLPTATVVVVPLALSPSCTAVARVRAGGAEVAGADVVGGADVVSGAPVVDWPGVVVELKGGAGSVDPGADGKVVGVAARWLAVAPHPQAAAPTSTATAPARIRLRRAADASAASAMGLRLRVGRTELTAPWAASSAGARYASVSANP